MTDIRICDKDSVQVPGDIRICDEQSTPAPGDIRICSDEDKDPCLSSDVPTVSGDGDCNVGDIYSASGGIGPYTWSFSGGSIDQFGEITAIDACSSPGDPRWARSGAWSGAPPRRPLTMLGNGTRLPPGGRYRTRRAIFSA